MGRPPAISNEAILVQARRCFLERGAGVSAVEIARALGVSHTTLFNRFGSKEGLMIAALGMPTHIPWAADFAAGPDETPIIEQLTRHGKVIADYFLTLNAGLAILQAAGIPSARMVTESGASSASVRAFRAFVDWLDRAQQQERIAQCDTETLAATIMGALYSRVITADLCGHDISATGRSLYVDRFMGLLWTGIDPAAMRS